MEKQNIDQINGMMALSEEINVLNQNVKSQATVNSVALVHISPSS